MKKIAILLCGNIRTWELCKQNFIESFGHLENADLFVCASNIQYDYHPVIAGRLNDFNDCLYMGIDDIKPMFSDMNMFGNIYYQLFNEVIEPHSLEIHPKFKHLHQNTFKHIDKLHKSFNFILANEIASSDEYDIIIKTRFDLKHNADVIKEINFDEITERDLIIDLGNVYPNDCILIGQPIPLDKLVVWLLQELKYGKYETSHIDPPHGLLKDMIKHCELNVITKDLMNCVVRKGGSEIEYR